MPLFRFSLQSLFDGLPDDQPFEIDAEFSSEDEAQQEQVMHDDAVQSDKPLTLWRTHCPHMFQFSPSIKTGGMDVEYRGPSDQFPPITTPQTSEDMSEQAPT
jgi:hypothetical protein